MTNRLNKHFISIILVLILSTTAALTAQNIQSLQQALASKNTDAVSTILDEASEEMAPVLEQMILDEARKSVNADDLDFAYTLAEIVLMYDFDNADAQSLYTSTEKAKKLKAENLARIQEEEKKRKEEEEKQRQLEEFEAHQQAQDKAKEEYIDSVKNVGFQNIPMALSISPAAFELFDSPFANQFNETNALTFRWGMSANALIGFSHPYFNATLTARFNFMPVSITGSGEKLDFCSRLALGIPVFSNWLKFTFSYSRFSIKNDQDSALFTNLTSPNFGLALTDLKIGDVFKCNLYGDFSLLTLDPDSSIDIIFMAESNLRFNLPVKIFANMQLFIENDTIFEGLQYSKKIEFSVLNNLCIGVSINDK